MAIRADAPQIGRARRTPMMKVGIDKRRIMPATAGFSENKRAATVREASDYSLRSTISFLISAIALAGFRFFGQALVQFMIVWQR